MIRYLREAKKAELSGVAMVRLDFNTKDGDWRMAAVLPTLRFLAKTSAAVVIVSHRGRPAGLGKIVNCIPQGFPKEFSLKKDAVDLSRLLGKKVTFVPHFDFPKIQGEILKSKKGSVFLLENVRFLEGEESNDAGLGKQLSSLADFYVNDAFAVSHRAQSSVVAITKYLPSYAGLEMEQEIKHLARVTAKPEHPLVVILGGAKASDK